MMRGSLTRLYNILGKMVLKFITDDMIILKRIYAHVPLLSENKHIFSLY
jgi:hypothetical protein